MITVKTNWYIFFSTAFFYDQISTMSGELPERSQEEGIAASALNQPASSALVMPSYVAPTGKVLALLFILSSFKSGKQVVFSLPQASTCVPLPQTSFFGNWTPWERLHGKLSSLQVFVRITNWKLSMENLGGSSELLDPENLGFFQMPS